MVTEGSIIHVYPDQFMLLVDGGKVVDYTAEPGYYKVSLDTQPSLMNGTLGKAVKESLGRIRFGGIAPTAQRVILYQSSGDPGTEVWYKKCHQLF